LQESATAYRHADFSTLAFPPLNGMEKKGYLVSRRAREERITRKYYRATALGRKAVKLATVKAKELFGEIVPVQRQPKRKRETVKR
jgi:DNA-binding PadR family transcriptional regulator